MKTRELFLKDPLSWTLANEGVSSNNEADEATLRYELETFVCEGEYESALEKVLNGFLSRLGSSEHAGGHHQPRQTRGRNQPPSATTMPKRTIFFTSPRQNYGPVLVS